ncbi:MAG TPA: hypothetical protein VF549_11000 [Solirubrobacteraceae bacterium]
MPPQPTSDSFRLALAAPGGVLDHSKSLEGLLRVCVLASHDDHCAGDEPDAD